MPEYCHISSDISGCQTIGYMMAASPCATMTPVSYECGCPPVMEFGHTFASAHDAGDPFVGSGTLHRQRLGQSGQPEIFSEGPRRYMYLTPSIQRNAGTPQEYDA